MWGMEAWRCNKFLGLWLVTSILKIVYTGQLTGHVTSVQCTVIVCTLSSPMSMARAYSTAGLSWTTYDLHQSMPCVLTKNSSNVYSNTTLVHTAYFKPIVMKLLVEWKKSLFEWYYWRSSCEVPNHVDRHAVHWEDKAMIMMSLDYHHHHRIVQQGQGEGRVHNFTEDGDVTGDVSDQEKDVD